MAHLMTRLVGTDTSVGIISQNLASHMMTHNF